MKYFLFFCLVALPAFFSARAQFAVREDQKLIYRMKESCRRVYFGFSTGINNPVGPIGLQADLVLSERVSIGSGLGLSGWGIKTFLESRYYFKPCKPGWAAAAGFTYSFGDTHIYTTEETVRGHEDVNISLNDQLNFMISAYRVFPLGKRGKNRFHLQAGYSVPMSSRFTQTDGPPLTARGLDYINSRFIQLIAPGGPILALGFSFGAGQR